MGVIESNTGFLPEYQQVTMHFKFANCYPGPGQPQTLNMLSNVSAGFQVCLRTPNRSLFHFPSFIDESKSTTVMCLRGGE